MSPSVANVQASLKRLVIQRDEDEFENVNEVVAEKHVEPSEIAPSLDLGNARQAAHSYYLVLQSRFSGARSKSVDDEAITMEALCTIIETGQTDQPVKEVLG